MPKYSLLFWSFLITWPSYGSHENTFLSLYGDDRPYGYEPLFGYAAWEKIGELPPLYTDFTERVIALGDAAPMATIEQTIQATVIPDSPPEAPSQHNQMYTLPPISSLLQQDALKYTIDFPDSPPHHTAEIERSFLPLPHNEACVAVFEDTTPFSPSPSLCSPPLYQMEYQHQPRMPSKRRERAHDAYIFHFSQFYAPGKNRNSTHKKTTTQPMRRNNQSRKLQDVLNPNIDTNPLTSHEAAWIFNDAEDNFEERAYTQAFEAYLVCYRKSSSYRWKACLGLAKTHLAMGDMGEAALYLSRIEFSTACPKAIKEEALLISEDMKKR